MGDRLSVLGACLLMTLIVSLPHEISAQPRPAPSSQKAAQGRQPAGVSRRMTNDDVIARSRARQSDEQIITAIRGSTEPRFETDARAIARLQRAGVSANVMGELRRVVAEQAARMSLARARTAALIDQTNSQASSGTDQQFRQLRAEVVSWKRFKVAERSQRPDVTLTFGPAYSATIRRRETGAVLWTGSGDTWTTVMSHMKKAVPPPSPSLCVALWCH